MAPSLPLVRLRLRYPDVDTFVERFAPNVTRGGIFLASREPRPVGDLLRFEVSLMAGKPVLAGSGRVTWVRTFDPAEPYRPHGMGVQFVSLEPSSRALLEMVLARKQAGQSGAPLTPSRSDAPATGPVRTGSKAPSPSYDEIETAVDEKAVIRALDRARTLSQSAIELESLLVRGNEETPTLAQALSDLPRLLAGPGARRSTGVFSIAATARVERTPAPAAPERPASDPLPSPTMESDQRAVTPAPAD